MRAKEFIIEEMTRGARNVIYQYVRTGASSFMKKMCFDNLRLYRGIDENVPFKHITTTLPKEVTNASLFDASFDIFNEFLNNNFNLTLNSSSHFTGDKDVAEFFGWTYLCIPIGKFKFVWNPNIDDHGNAVSFFMEKEMKRLLGDKASKMSAIELGNELGRMADENEPKFHSKVMNDYINEHGKGYIDRDIQKACASGNEIILQGSYIAINCNETKFINEMLDYFTKRFTK